MRNRWFHRPLLHTEHGPEKKASWLELFYDLIFVASIIQLGDGLSNTLADDPAGSMLRFGVHFAPLWFAWSSFTFYSNRFDVDDILHRVLVFGQMFAVGAMGITAPLSMRIDSPDHLRFTVAFVAALMFAIAMTARAYKHTKDARAYNLYWGGVFVVGASVWSVSLLVPEGWHYILWVMGILAMMSAPLHPRSRALMDQFPLDQEHLSERYGLLTIITLGESFVKVLSYLATPVEKLKDLNNDGVVAFDEVYQVVYYAADPAFMGMGALTLLITCSLWWIYFDDVAGSHLREGLGNWVVWLFAHLPLAGAITGVGVAVKNAIKIDFLESPSPYYATLLTVMLAVVFFSVALIDKASYRKQSDLDDAWRVRLRVLSGFIVLLVGAVSGLMTGWLFLGTVALVCLFQVVVDMMMSPLEETEDMVAVTTSDLARQRAAGTSPEKPERRRFGPGITVRKGTPRELRADLYFWLIDGSWTRLMVVFGGLFLFLNMVFAALYLLGGDGAITGTRDDGFLAAFAFSVQTMSTIGFGSLAPGSDYADLLVTIEALVGLLGVALATGLMFAKASRPSSKVLFSQNMLLTMWHGKPTLLFRVGNARGNEVADAKMTVSVLKEEISDEGHHLRRVHDIALTRSTNPIFSMSWLLQHVIDEDSPLHGVDWDQPENQIMLIICSMLGHDATYGQTIHARHIYHADQVLTGRRFVDVISQLPDGRMLIDYEKFHDTVPDVDEAAAS
ncbi:MAG: low temperature requirement protein A [Chloroflexota bacterium]